MTYARRELPRSRILIVEDNTDLRRVLSEILQYEGFDVVSAASAEEAITMLEADATLPQLAISDILMEGMDGCAFLTTIRANPRWRVMPVVFLSGQMQSPDVCGPDGPHPDAYVEKPFTIQDLVATITLTIQRGHVDTQS